MTSLLEWLPESDFGVMDHGFVPHGRDYYLLVECSMGQNQGRHQLQFTHIAELSYTTVVADDVWAKSWGEAFVDYQAWLDAGEPDGYVWGTCWSLAWPGIRAVEPSTKAIDWSARFGKSMYEAQIETDRFRINLVFHSLRSAKVSDETSTVSSVVIPLS
ncbi:hypothetical protein [Thermomonas sp. HDW16]|uniref:YxiG-like protein n=1 Tax=Thermomonas sp. HDW16 TaxID=2714945 RepID=UPI0014096761|nr:hypothetical protein [Thermomonas sp. HDW16]QIL21083.1 hypothetical protein G7079_10290 [Thermomonas sp. HDW16]